LAKLIAPGVIIFHNGRFTGASHWGNMKIVSTYDEITIDYERIEEILVEFGGDWYDAVIREGQIYDFGRVKDALVAAIRDIK
jgi:hypothetical protein